MNKMAGAMPRRRASSAKPICLATAKNDKAVVVSVTSPNKEAVWAIQTRAKHLADAKA